MTRRQRMIQRELEAKLRERQIAEKTKAMTVTSSVLTEGFNPCGGKNKHGVDYNILKYTPWRNINATSESKNIDHECRQYKGFAVKQKRKK